MITGIAIGKFYGISNFQLTPPIDAIKSIFRGTYEFNIPNTIVLGMVIGLFMMMYPAMANIKFEDLGKAAKSPGQLLIVVFFNYAVAPFFMLLLAKLFLHNEPLTYTQDLCYMDWRRVSQWSLFLPISIRRQCASRNNPCSC